MNQRWFTQMRKKIDELDLLAGKFRHAENPTHKEEKALLLLSTRLDDLHLELKKRAERVSERLTATSK